MCSLKHCGSCSPPADYLIRTADMRLTWLKIFTHRIVTFFVTIALPFAARAYVPLPFDALVSPAFIFVSMAPVSEGFVHDAVGNLLSASNAVFQNAFTYDAMDRIASAMTTVSNFTYTAAYARDAGGLVTNLTYAPGKSVTRSYDADGYLTSVSDWLGHTWTFAWDGTGKPTGSTSPGGITATNHYDATGRLASWSVGALAGLSITRDAAGLKTREDITAGPHPAPSFVRYAENTFDAADRLVSASVRYGSHTNAPVAETYHYDGNGALTNLVSGSSAVFNAAYSPLGQLSSLNLRTSAPSAVYSYDPIGKYKQGLRARPISSGGAPSSITISRPFRASHYLFHSPGRCPGLVCCALSGLSSTLSRAVSVTLSPLSKATGKAHAKARGGMGENRL